MNAYPKLKEKIENLESEAIAIESDMVQYFKSIESRDGSNYNWYYLPTGKLAEKHRTLIMRYEKWYNQSHILIRSYYKEKEKEFVELHDGITDIYSGPDHTPFTKPSTIPVTRRITVSYGISELLQFSGEVRNLVFSCDDFVQKITGLFTKQRAILLALPEVLDFLPSDHTDEKKTELISFEKKVSTSQIPLLDQKFEIALSFPGEYRDKIRQIAEGLSKTLGNQAIFYDKYYEAELARPNLDDILQSIYKKQSKLVVVFLCAEYENKDWCGLEWRAIKELIKSRKDDAIMLIKLEDFDISELKGLFSYDGYLDIRGREESEVISLIISRYQSMGNSKKIPTDISLQKPIPTLNNSDDLGNKVKISQYKEQMNNRGMVLIEGIVQNGSDNLYEVCIRGFVYDLNKIKCGNGLDVVTIDPKGKSRFNITIPTGIGQFFEHKCIVKIETIIEK
jgi:hypothetical protein